VLVDGLAPDRNPVVQARAGAARLRQILQRYTGRDIHVRPVALYPGWFVEPQPPGVSTWVLNEKAFIGFLDREPSQINSEECKILAEGFARFVREQFDKKGA
jgi:hypothetical protein